MCKVTRTSLLIKNTKRSPISHLCHYPLEWEGVWAPFWVVTYVVLFEWQDMWQGLEGQNICGCLTYVNLVHEEGETMANYLHSSK